MPAKGILSFPTFTGLEVAHMRGDDDTIEGRSVLATTRSTFVSSGTVIMVGGHTYADYECMRSVRRRMIAAIGSELTFAPCMPGMILDIRSVRGELEDGISCGCRLLFMRPMQKITHARLAGVVMESYFSGHVYSRDAIEG